MKVFYVRPAFSKELSISLKFPDISVLYTVILRVLLLLPYLLFFFLIHLRLKACGVWKAAC